MIEAGMDMDFPSGKAGWHCCRVEIHCGAHPVETDASSWGGRPVADIKSSATPRKVTGFRVCRQYVSHRKPCSIPHMSKTLPTTVLL
jgi:hypothetical protein